MNYKKLSSILVFILLAVSCYASDTVIVTAGETITEGDILCYRSSTTKWEKVTTDNCDFSTRPVFAIALSDLSTDDVGSALVSGIESVKAAVTVSSGDRLYLDLATDKMTTVVAPMDYYMGIALTGTSSSDEEFQMFKTPPRLLWDTYYRYSIPNVAVKHCGLWTPDQVAWGGTPVMTAWLMPAPDETSDGGVGQPGNYVIRYKTNTTANNQAGLSKGTGCITVGSGSSLEVNYHLDTTGTCGSTPTNTRTWIALTDTDLGAIAPATGPTAGAAKFIGMVCDTNIDNYWHLCSGDGSNRSCDMSTTLGPCVDTSTPQCLDNSMDGGVARLSLDLKLDGSTRQFNTVIVRPKALVGFSTGLWTALLKTTNLPADNTNMCPEVIVRALTTAQRVIDIASVQACNGSAFQLPALDWRN